jgi:hypothetical protein
MSQTTFSDFSAPQTTLQVFDCSACLNQKGLFSIEDTPKVRCLGRIKDIPKGGCPSFSDGKELEYMASFAPPRDFVLKKWAGGRA